MARTRKPETLALIVALASTLAVLFVFLTDLTLARQRDLEAAERRLQQFGVMMAEHTARSFEAVDVLVREVATDLSINHSNWSRWDPARGWDYVAQRHSRAMPQLRDLIVIDRFGDQRFISTYFPPPRINVIDHPYFVSLRDGGRSATFGPYVGQNSGRYTYGIAHRLSDSSDGFMGVAFAAIEPGYMQDFCWSNRLADAFDAVLTNSEGKIVASCRPTDLSQQSPLIGQAAGQVLFNGRPAGLIPETGLARGNGLLISVSPVQGFSDLRLVAILEQSSALASWQGRLFELGTLGALVSTLLLTGALLVRRQVRELSEATEALADNRDQLELRVREATAELAGEKETAERANAAKSRFLAAASHDLRQPLHALSLFSADLRRQASSGKLRDVPRLAEQIAASTAILGEMLDALLDISRLDISGIKADPQTFSLASLFERLDASFRRSATDRQLNLRFHPGKYFTHTDPMLLERMLGNLISNALRYTPAGGRILVGARRDGDGVRIEVRDNGVGIAREHKEAVFAEFYQVANTAREQDGGLGLGLSIVDRLARALNIPVTLNSRVGEGTTFALRLPRKHRAPVLAQREESAGHIHFIGNSQAIDDCRSLAAGWHYQTSSGEGDALQRLRSDTIVICDDESIPKLDRQMRLIVLCRQDAPELPAGAHALTLPLRPARLRALLRATSA